MFGLSKVYYRVGIALVLTILSAYGCRNDILGHQQQNDTFIQFSAMLSVRQNISAKAVLTGLYNELTAAALSETATQDLFDKAVKRSFGEQVSPRIYALGLVNSTSTSVSSGVSVREVMTADGTAVSCTSSGVTIDRELTLLFTYQLAPDLTTPQDNEAAVCSSICNHLCGFAVPSNTDFAASLATLATVSIDESSTLASSFASEYSLLVGSPAGSALQMINGSQTIFSRQHLSSDDLCFALIGDWGKGGLTGDITNMSATSTQYSNEKGGKNDKDKNKNKNTYTYQNAVAKSIYAVANGAYDMFGHYSSTDTAEVLKPSFIGALGDNFYAYGVASADDSQWESSWQNIYITNPAFPTAVENAMLNLSWYAIFGNHDYGYGSAGTEAQIQRTNSSYNFNGLWKFPAQFYSHVHLLPVQRPLLHASSTSSQQLLVEQVFNASSANGTDYAQHSVKIIYLDTTTLSPSMNKCCNANGGISEELQLQRITSQLAFIEEELQAARAYTWVVVAGHYPMYSTGGHGDGTELQTYLLPLLLKYGVHAYVCGHDHISEHLSLDGVHYFITGAGAMTDKVGATSSSANVHWSGGGFSAFSTVTASSSELCFTYFNITGHMVYNYTIRHPSLVNQQFVANYSNSGSANDYLTDSGRGGTVADEEMILVESLVLGLGFSIILAVLFYCFAIKDGTANTHGQHMLLHTDAQSSSNLDSHALLLTTLGAITKGIRDIEKFFIRMTTGFNNVNSESVAIESQHLTSTPTSTSEDASLALTKDANV